MPTAAAADAPKPLAEKLTRVAIAIVREQGDPDTLSMREVQRRAGVSPTAAYRHFRDREALLLAVAQKSAALFANHLAAALDRAPKPVDEPAARARLLAACEAYLEFATRDPGLYRAIFFGEGGYNLLAAALQDLATGTPIDDTSVGPWDPLAVWSCCHGLALLRMDALRSLSDEGFRQARDRVLRTIAGAVPAI